MVSVQIVNLYFVIMHLFLILGPHSLMLLLLELSYSSNFLRILLLRIRIYPVINRIRGFKLDHVDISIPPTTTCLTVMQCLKHGSQFLKIGEISNIKYVNDTYRKCPIKHP